MVWAVDNVFDMVESFTEVAAAGPVSAVLLVLGTLLFAVAFAVGGVLVLGAVVDALIPDSPGRAPPRERR